MRVLYFLNNMFALFIHPRQEEGDFWVTLCNLCLCFLYLSFVYSAKVKDYLSVVPWEGLELVVGSEHYYNVGLVVGFLVVGELELLVFVDIGFYNEYVGVVAYLHYSAHNVFCGGFAQVVDVGLEFEAHHCNKRFAPVL